MKNQTSHQNSVELETFMTFLRNGNEEFQTVARTQTVTFRYNIQFSSFIVSF